MAGMADPNAAVELSLDRANRLILGGAGSTLEILKEADTLLSKRLQGVAKRNGGLSSRYTEAHAQLYREQIRMVTSYLQERMRGKTDEQARAAIAVAVQQTVNLATLLEERFTGIARPLALHSQANQDAIIKGTNASRIRQNAASWERYGAAMTRKFETILRVGAIAGLPQSTLISHMVEAGKAKGITAESLHQATPGWFPDPTGYVRECYWAERIVRTETANALNEASLNTMTEMRNTDFPDMQKKILAHFDVRTAPDSVAVHGQIRAIDGYFRDGAGREYLRPPGRPNDRETVIPWRPHWAEMDSTEQPKAEEVREAVEKIQGKEAAKARAKSLRTERAEQRKARRTALAEQVSARAAAIKQQREERKAPAELGGILDAFTPHNAAFNLEALARLLDQIPETLTAEHAARLIAATGANVPVELAMKHPRLVAAIQKIDVQDYNYNWVSQSVAQFAKLDPKLVQRTVHRGTLPWKGAYFGLKELPSLDELGYLRGVTPRGWDSGTTWDKVGGCANPQQIAVAVGGRSGSTSTPLHEFGHVIGKRTIHQGFSLDESPEMAAHHRRMHPRLQPYLQQGGPGGTAGMSETFAESIADFHMLPKEQFVATYDQEYYQWLRKVLKM